MYTRATPIEFGDGVSIATCTGSLVRLPGAGAESRGVRSPSLLTFASGKRSSLLQFVARTCSASPVQHGLVIGGKIGRQSSLTVQFFLSASSERTARRQK